MVLFKTTESVIEVLWDIALAFFVVRLAAIYAALTAGAALVASLVLHYLPDLPLPHLLSSDSGGSGRLHLPLVVLASSVLCSQLLIARYQIPRNGPFRLAVGVAAAVFGMVGQEVVRLVLYGVGWRLAEGMMLGWGTWVGLTGAIAVMPVVWMGAEKGWDAVVEGEKNIGDSVPAVGGSEKRKVERL
ncbi:MARVEL domain-containing protein [Madurella fahalii]|uniref:MARVEL domain-containing protein n=1 Tax=Madurella fahalii TaxID=1157608 RepID=A0ABQ0FYD4_9PEZI